MKECGVDGLSRGDLLEGILKGGDPLKYFPFDKSVWDRDMGRVKTWLQDVWKMEDGRPWGGRDLTFLTPEGWFEEGHGGGAYVAPPHCCVCCIGNVCRG